MGYKERFKKITKKLGLYSSRFQVIGSILNIIINLIDKKGNTGHFWGSAKSLNYIDLRKSQRQSNTVPKKIGMIIDKIIFYNMEGLKCYV